jgi:hypothetical protein
MGVLKKGFMAAVARCSDARPGAALDQDLDRYLYYAVCVCAPRAGITLVGCMSEMLGWGPFSNRFQQRIDI